MRETCRRCLRPTAFCVCEHLPLLEARTQVVILQHPREARLAICSAWLCHAALAGSELYATVKLDEHPRVRALCQAPGTWLLFPGEGAVPAASLAGAPPAALIVIDATWPQAVKLLRKNPRVAALPRLALAPGTVAPSGYQGLREEPAEGHLATIDAVAEALGALESDPARFAPMRAAFRLAVERQIACSQDQRRTPRHRPGTPRAQRVKSAATRAPR
ncbi:MAG: DTW domain-containing protein [Anaeromyxobacter sp.]|nr:DTW domain-containing protein [Anaeromyxobacter sp.]MBL0274938.1 DTW domain-containing protein [Anaeromyxobacter sp.]